MATNTGFKQQCPHCDARVPIKDESLIGEEINCPKCKKPFVVEDPEDAQSTEAENKRRPKKEKEAKQRGDEEEQPSSSKDKKKSKMVLGLALAGAAVVLLGVAAFFMFGGSSENKSSAAGAGSGPKASGASAGQAQKAVEPPKLLAATPGQGPAVGSVLQPNPSNLLPNETEVVVSVQMKEMVANRFGQTLFDSGGGSQAHSFRADYGIAVHEIDRLLVAGSASEGWGFVICRTDKGIKFDAVKKALRLHEPELPIRGQEYFLSSFNWLPPGSPLRTNESGAVTTAEAPGTRPLAVRLVDSQTLAMGDVAPMKIFLDAKGQPANFARPAASPAPARPATPPPAAPAPGNPPGGGRGRRPDPTSSQSLDDAPPPARALQDAPRQRRHRRRVADRGGLAAPRRLLLRARWPLRLSAAPT